MALPSNLVPRDLPEQVAEGTMRLQSAGDGMPSECTLPGRRLL